MAKLVKNYRRLMTTKFWTPKTPFFYIKDKKYIYIQNIEHKWGYVHADSWDI